MRHFHRLLGQSSEGARVLERDGVMAAIVPACRERPVINSVLYEGPGALAEAYDEIAGAYAEIGANWTVWVHPGDGEAGALLEQKGHFLDAEPAAMGRALAGIERPPQGALLHWTANGRVADVGPINDRAYQFGSDSFARALARFPAGEAHVYTASADGEPVACLMVIDYARNADVQWVAVLPHARGKGLSGKLLAHALADASERGIETTTLVATRLGRPVYERLGYRTLGNLQMWEWRAA